MGEDDHFASIFNNSKNINHGNLKNLASIQPKKLVNFSKSYNEPINDKFKFKNYISNC